MPFARVLLVSFLVLGACALGGAHWLVSNTARPTYNALCRTPGVAVLANGFGSDDAPHVEQACAGGQPIAVTARMERGELVLESSTAALLALDGQRSSSALEVRAETVDHGQDIWWGRLLEMATPFTDFDRTEPIQGTDQSRRLVEIGRPRVSELPSGGSRATIEVGSHASDDSLSVLVLARPAGERAAG